MHRLTALSVQKLKTPGKYADGGGLYLQISKAGGKYWIFRYMYRGKMHEMGLGPARLVTLEQARQKSKAHQTTLKVNQLNPLEERAAIEARRNAEALAKTRTFETCAETYVSDVKGPELTNPKHREQWLSTLRAYAFPTLGGKLIADITMQMVKDTLQPIWLEKTETASRVRQRMEAVFAWAKVQGYRSGDNPAAWRGGLDHLLPNPSKIKVEEHFPCLPFDQTPAFVRSLRAHAGMSARALEWLIYSASRTLPVLQLEWSEIDRERRIWTAPPEKMKSSNSHRVPLTPPMTSLLDRLEPLRDGPYVFHNHGKPLSNAAMLMLVSGMHTHETPWIDPKQGGRRITPHGFRSTFRDWAGEMTDFSEEICELSLAHVRGTKTEAAYRRADALEKRRLLMQRWADFCLPPEKDPAEAG